LSWERLEGLIGSQSFSVNWRLSWALLAESAFLSFLLVLERGKRFVAFELV